MNSGFFLGPPSPNLDIGDLWATRKLFLDFQIEVESASIDEMRRRYLEAIIVVALVAMSLAYLAPEQPVHEPSIPTSRFELQLYTQGGSMEHPQDSPPLFSLEFKCSGKPSAASVKFWSTVDGEVYTESLSVEGTRGAADFAHFWGKDLAGQPVHAPGKAEWWTNSLMSFAGWENREGKYLLEADGAKTTIELDAPQTVALAPTNINAVEADPADGFLVNWTPVAGAIGYKVCVRQGSYPNYIEWNNSNEDWLTLGSELALSRGVLLANTSCAVPGGIFDGPVYVDVQAVSSEIRALGELDAVAWAESNRSLEVGIQR